MPEPDLIDLFIGPLESGALDAYMISGSVASIEYGEPRATLDIDIAISLPAAEAERLADLYPAPEFYCPPLDVLMIELKRPARGHFNVIHPGSGLKADFYPSKAHPLLPWALAHRRRISMADRQVWMAPPEYVILWKLEFYREGRDEKHLRDIRGMLSVSAAEIDLTVIKEAISLLGLEDVWSQCEP